MVRSGGGVADLETGGKISDSINNKLNPPITDISCVTGVQIVGWGLGGLVGVAIGIPVIPSMLGKNLGKDIGIMLCPKNPSTVKAPSAGDIADITGNYQTPIRGAMPRFLVPVMVRQVGCRQIKRYPTASTLKISKR